MSNTATENILDFKQTIIGNLPNVKSPGGHRLGFWSILKSLSARSLSGWSLWPWMQVAACRGMTRWSLPSSSSPRTPASCPRSTSPAASPSSWTATPWRRSAPRLRMRLYCFKQFKLLDKSEIMSKSFLHSTNPFYLKKTFQKVTTIWFLARPTPMNLHLYM